MRIFISIALLTSHQNLLNQSRRSCNVIFAQSAALYFENGARPSDGLLYLEIFRSSQASLSRNFAELDLGNVHKS